MHYGDDRHWVSGNMGVFVQVRGCDHWEFRDGKVIRKDSYWKLVESRS